MVGVAPLRSRHPKEKLAQAGFFLPAWNSRSVSPRTTNSLNSVQSLLRHPLFVGDKRMGDVLRTSAEISLFSVLQEPFPQAQLLKVRHHTKL